MDFKPREFSLEQRHLLKSLAKMVISELELRTTFMQKEIALERQADNHANTKAQELNTAYIGQVLCVHVCVSVSVCVYV